MQSKGESVITKKYIPSAAKNVKRILPNLSQRIMLRKKIYRKKTKSWQKIIQQNGSASHLYEAIRTNVFATKQEYLSLAFSYADLLFRRAILHSVRGDSRIRAEPRLTSDAILIPFRKQGKCFTSCRIYVVRSCPFVIVTFYFFLIAIRHS